ncbi:DUF177 domain-containing protein [Trinickia sp. NRRL B-1857]|uniref:DUF177 domain-containing protein n=1 Tax=Trinickia sp. NRRL B-1857 TaxID=3162879 RepID=UPI003D279BAC
MSQDTGKAGGLIDPHAFDVFEFARSGRQAAGALRVSQLPRMLNEVPADAPDRETLFTWQAEGSTQPELQDDGTEAAQPYLRLALHGVAWLECQRCLSPYEQSFDVDATYRLVVTEEQAEEFPLDEDELDVIVGSRQFDLVELIEEELLLSLPLVPKHDVCPLVHESLVSGAAGEHASDLSEDESESDSEDPTSGAAEQGDAGKPNPFAALEALKRASEDEGGKKH